MFENVHIDCFSALDDLPKKHHGDDDKVLAILKKTKRCSCFELEDSAKLARTITRLNDSGKIRLINAHYPWFRVVVNS